MNFPGILEENLQMLVCFWIVIVALALLDAILKAFALWHSARKNQQAWFVCLIVFNTCGILPLIYLLANHKNNKKVA